MSATGTGPSWVTRMPTDADVTFYDFDAQHCDYRVRKVGSRWYVRRFNGDVGDDMDLEWFIGVVMAAEGLCYSEARNWVFNQVAEHADPRSLRERSRDAYEAYVDNAIDSRRGK